MPNIGSLLPPEYPALQRLPLILLESRWDPEKVNTRKLLLADPATMPHWGTGYW